MRLPLRPSTCVVSQFLPHYATSRPRPRTRAERRADAVWSQTARIALRQPITLGPRLVTEVSRGR